jgi:hypothetical protein
MKYSLSKKTAYPAELIYHELPDDLADVSEVDHIRIVNRLIGEDFVIYGDGSVVIIPVRPSPAHDWDAEKQAWFENKARAAELAEAAARAAIPKSVTMRQARRAMIDAGIYEKVDAAIKQAGGKALVDWEYSNTFDRSNPMIESMATQLKLTEKQIDELFIKASKESLP